MYPGSINSSIKKGVSENAYIERHKAQYFDNSRRRLDTLIQRKRERIEPAANAAFPNAISSTDDISRLNEYVAIIFTQDPSFCLDAVKNIRRLLSQIRNGLGDKKYISDVISTGIIPKLIQFLSYDNLPKLQFESTWTLTNITCGDSDQTAVVVQSGAIDPLLRLMYSPHLEVQGQAIWTLSNIAGDCDDYREHILRLGGFGQIVEVASHHLDKVSIVINAVWCLTNLCRCQRDKVFMFECVQPHLSFLQSMLVYKNMEVIANACWAFSFLTSTPPEQKKIVLQYINPKDFMRYILCEDSAIRCPAIRVAGNFVSGDKEDTQLMLDGGLVQVLNSVLSFPLKDEMKREILWIISNVAAGTSKQIRILIHEGLMKEIVKKYLAPTEADIVQTEALWVVVNAINGGLLEHIRYLVDQKVIPPLVRLLPKVSHLGLKRNILISLYRILKVGEHIQSHCRMENNPYLVFFRDEGGFERVEECSFIPDAHIQEVCQSILKRCHTAEDEDLILPNI